jgi:hypothetical protein
VGRLGLLSQAHADVPSAIALWRVERVPIESARRTAATTDTDGRT